ncbi:MAG: ABC transporter permease [Gaiellales bacterium]|jgi:ABC-2 type transport system permease protein
MSPGRTLRLLWVGWRFHLANLTQSGFFVLVSAVQPVIFATIAFYMWRSGQREGTLLAVALGAGLMGMWSSTLFGSGGAIQFQRWHGTLEVLIAAPAPFILTLLPITIATASLGLYSVAGTLAWGWLLFGMPVDIVHPGAFAVALPAAVLSLGLLGLVLASTFVLYRSASAFSNLLEYPVWLVTGLLVPVSLLPGFVEPLSWVLAPTWGVKAIRRAALGGDPWPAVGMCLLLGCIYLVVGAFTLRNFERLARAQATLSLT